MSRERPYKLVQLDEVRWEIPKTGGMRVPGLIYTDSSLLPDIETDQSADQVYNVAHLPGIVGHSLAMPDVHWGYGFPIGGVAAFDLDEGVVSPGGVGYDINCGVRLALTGLTREDLLPRIRELIDALFVNVPSGLGSRGGIRLNKKELSQVLKLGAEWAIQQRNGESPGSTAHRRIWKPRGSRSGCDKRSSLRERKRPAGDIRLRQSFHGDRFY